MFARGFALLVGAYLLISGVWGLFSDTVWWIFTTDTLHALIEIALGLAAFYMASRRNSRAWVTPVSALLLAVGVIWFIPGIDVISRDLLNANLALAIFNVGIGLIGFAAVRAPRAQSVNPADAPFMMPR